LRILITGASGFIGSKLISKLADSEVEILALGRNVSQKNNSNIRWHNADLTKPNSYESTISDFSPNIVVHLSWQDIPDYSLEASVNNLYQSINFISFVSGLISCERVIISGSCSEYGNVNGQCSEQNTLYPTSYLGLSKKSLYEWAKITLEMKSIDLFWFRIFYVYGPGQRKESLIPSIFSSLSMGNEPVLKTPLNSNDYIYISDVISAFETSILRDVEPGVYNLGSGKSYSAIEICSFTEKIIKNSNKLSYSIMSKLQSTKIDRGFWSDISKAKSKLHWSPKVKIEDGISLTWNSLIDS